jgi:hypothetical protein
MTSDELSYFKAFTETVSYPAHQETQYTMFKTHFQLMWLLLVILYTETRITLANCVNFACGTHFVSRYNLGFTTTFISCFTSSPTRIFVRLLTPASTGETHLAALL